MNTIPSGVLPVTSALTTISPLLDSTLRARSIVSFGIEYDRAFSIAFCSARFAAGSPPPSFAATMIARVSFEKSLPRFASAAPFLCLIVDHLLCPDMHPRSRRRQRRRLRSLGAHRRVYARFL